MKNIQEYPLQTMISRAEDQVSADLDGSTVLMKIQNGMYYGIDIIGSQLWALLENPISLDSLIKTLQKNFKGDPEQIKSDTMDFLQELNEEDLIRIID